MVAAQMVGDNACGLGFSILESPDTIGRLVPGTPDAIVRLIVDDGLVDHALLPLQLDLP